jgi:THAP domain-containing protein 4
MDKTLINFDKIKPLFGKWKGFGLAEYPTIKTEEYREEISFTKIDEFAVLQYEQKTWIKNEKGDFKKPIFRETGFLRALEGDNKFELCNVQKSGRVEVLSGEFYQKKEINYLDFKSKIFANDEKLIDTSRKFIFTSETFDYELWISIKSNKSFERHLKASLKKTQPQ